MQMEKGLINESFFYPQRAPKYIQGAFYRGYIPLGNYGIMFQNPSSKLVGNVVYHLEIKSPMLTTKPINGDISDIVYQIQIYAPKLNSRLKKMNVPEEKRKFPKEISNRLDVCDFSRGFLDASLPYFLSEEDFLIIPYKSVPFLRELYEVWVKNKFIKGGKEISGPQLSLSLEDRISLSVHLYQDQEYLQRHRLYLPKTKRLLRSVFTLFGSKVDEEVMDILDLLLARVTGKKIANLKGCSYPTLCRLVKDKTGKTITQLLQEYKIRIAPLLVIQDAPISQISAELGFKNPDSFYDFFKTNFGITPKQYRREHDQKPKL